MEATLTDQSQIYQAYLFGDGRSSLQALLVAASCTNDIHSAAEQANERLPEYTRIGHWELVDRFTVQNGHLTTTGKMRREMICITYTEIIHANDYPKMPERYAAQ